MNPSKAKQAQAQRKYHEKKFGDAAYRERRKQIQIRYRLNAKQKKKIRVGSEEQHPSSLEETHPRVDVVETLPITTWTCASHIELTEQLPKCGKGEVSTCPRTLVGDNAIAAFALEGISSYLQNHWNSEEMTELLSVAEYDIPNITGLRTITGNRYEFYVRVKNCTPAAFYTLLMYLGGKGGMIHIWSLPTRTCASWLDR